MRRPTLVFACLAFALTIAPRAVADDTGLAPISPVSPNVESAREMYWLLLAVAAVIFFAVVVPLVLFTLRYRSRGRPRAAEGPQIRGHSRLELLWTAVPAAFLVIIVAVVFWKLPSITHIEGEDELDVRVEGRQFYWQFEYPNGVIAIDRLRAPLDQVVNLEITAPVGDVNHSFWVPPIGAKLDAIPGELNRTSFKARETGVYRGQCTEFCGLQHAAMLTSIEVIPREEFDTWLAEQARAQENGTSDLGAQIWAGVCSKCHGADVVGEVGPRLEGNPAVANRVNVESIVRNGRGAMPAVGRDWSDRQVEALFDYLEENVARGD